MTTRPSQHARVALRLARLMWIAVWAITSAPGMACAQLDQGPVPPAPVVVAETVSSSSAEPIVVRGPQDPDYWIVSSRCHKEQVEAGQAIDYQVYRFDGPQPGRGTSMDELLASLRPGVPVCFMVHGSFVTWDSMLEDSAYTYRWLRQAAPSQPVHVIFYTWASDDAGCLPHLRVNKLGRRASLNGFYVADLVTRVSANHPVCLIGHSHGARMVSAALHTMGGGAVEGRYFSQGAQPVRKIRVVLAAAAMDHHWLNPEDRFGRALCQTEAMINLQNHIDLPLLFYPLRRPISGKALAISGVTRRDRQSLGWHNQKIVDYSVTDLVGIGHIWENYYNQPMIADVIRHYVYFDDCTVRQE
jgi:hypothetical protein